MKMFYKFLMLFIVCAIQAGYALNNQDEYSTLKLTIINHSKYLLTYTKVDGTKLGNTFSIDTNYILPGGRAVVVGKTNSFNDLVGTLHFTDSTGNGNLFKILDYRQFHVGQPIFVMDNEHFVSFVKSRTFNPNTNPHALTIVAAEIEIEDH